MLLATTGMRAVEALNICVKDIEIENKYTIIYIQRRKYQN